jgi:hypothetical protein
LVLVNNPKINTKQDGPKRDQNAKLGGQNLATKTGNRQYSRRSKLAIKFSINSSVKNPAQFRFCATLSISHTEKLRAKQQTTIHNLVDRGLTGSSLGQTGLFGKSRSFFL